MSDSYAALRVPAFRRFILGAVLVHIGTAAQSLAIGWEMYKRTDATLVLGLVGLTQAVPMLVFTLPAGYLADIFDRRKIMVVGMIGTTLTSIALATYSFMQGRILIMFGLLFLDAAFHRLTGPARAALLPQLLPRQLFENAMKWRTTLFHLAAVIGPAVGGVIISWSIPAAYLFSAATTTGFIFLICSLPLPQGNLTKPGPIWNKVAEGIAFVWRRKLILGTVSLDLFAVLLGGAVYLLPVFARDILHSPPFGMTPEQVLGWLRAAPAAGSIVMAVILTHLPPFRNAGRTMLWAVAAFGAATVVFGLSKNFWLSWAMLFLTGFFDNISVVVRHTLVQLATPNEMRGRVSAVNSVFIGASNEMGGFESGLVAHWFGPIVSVVSGGIGTIAVVGTWMKLFPGLHKFGALADIHDHEDQTVPPQG